MTVRSHLLKGKALVTWHVSTPCFRARLHLNKRREQTGQSVKWNTKPPHRNSHRDKHCRDEWGEILPCDVIMSRPFVIVVESTFRLLLIALGFAARKVKRRLHRSIETDSLKSDHITEMSVPFGCFIFFFFFKYSQSTELKQFGIHPLSTLSLFVFSNYLDTRASSAVESTRAH